MLLSLFVFLVAFRGATRVIVFVVVVAAPSVVSVGTAAAAVVSTATAPSFSLLHAAC